MKRERSVSRNSHQIGLVAAPSFNGGPGCATCTILSTPYAVRPTPPVTIGSASPHEPINDACVSLKFQSYTRVDKKPLCYQVYREAFLLNGARSFAVAATALKAGQTLSISWDHPNRRLLLFALCQIELHKKQIDRMAFETTKCVDCGKIFKAKHLFK